MKKNCLICGKEFDGKPNRIYCGRECLSLHRMSKTEKIEKTCKYCGKKFNVSLNDKKEKNKIYCGNKCYYESIKNDCTKNKIKKRKLYKRICKQCGKEFLSKNINAKFCNKECYTDNRRVINKFICLKCGKEFIGESKNRKFCSFECSRQNQKDKGINFGKNLRVKITCKNCGKVFMVWKYRENEAKYCSKKCFNIKHGVQESKLEKRVFNFLKKYYNIEKRTLVYDGGIFYPDIIYNDKIIEIFGDYWHCNPLKYDEDYITRKGITAKEIRENDAIRIDKIKNLGYDVLVCWEHDIVNNEKETMNKMINFLGENNV